MTIASRTVSFSRSAELHWEGDVVRGSGRVSATTAAFEIPVRFPGLRGEPAGVTSPEELLAASHAACYGIGLRSVIARSGGSADRVIVTATITAEKGPEGIRVRRSHLSGIVEGLSGVDARQLKAVGALAAEECTISNAIRESVEITHQIVER